VLADTSVLRAFAASGQLHLLRAFAPVSTTRRVLNEIERSGKAAIMNPISQALKDGWLIQTGEWPRPESVARIAMQGAGALSDTDIEVLALAHDLKVPLLIHDSRAFRVGEAEGVECHDLLMVLAALKEAGVLATRKAMFEAIFRIESMDGKSFPEPLKAALLRYEEAQK
jgi:predicted nucleic acid-binding protein